MIFEIFWGYPYDLGPPYPLASSSISFIHHGKEPAWQLFERRKEQQNFHRRGCQELVIPKKTEQRGFHHFHHFLIG